MGIIYQWQGCLRSVQKVMAKFGKGTVVTCAGFEVPVVGVVGGARPRSRALCGNTLVAPSTLGHRSFKRYALNANNPLDLGRVDV